MHIALRVAALGGVALLVAPLLGGLHRTPDTPPPPTRNLGTPLLELGQVSASPRFADSCFVPAPVEAVQAPPAASWQNARAQPLSAASPALQARAAFVGQLATCFTTPDGLPREVAHAGGARTYPSTHVETCTALLLPDNRLLAMGPCLPDAAMTRARLAPARMRVRLGQDRLFEVNPLPLARAEGLGAAIFNLTGDANAALGGDMALSPLPAPSPGTSAVLLFHDPKGAAWVLTEGCATLAPARGSVQAEGTLLSSCDGQQPLRGGVLLDRERLAVLGLQWRALTGGRTEALSIAALMKHLGAGVVWHP